MLMIVHSFVRPFGPKMCRAVNLHLSRSESTHRTISIQIIKIRVTKGGAYKYFILLFVTTGGEAGVTLFFWRLPLINSDILTQLNSYIPVPRRPIEDWNTKVAAIPLTAIGVKAAIGAKAEFVGPSSSHNSLQKLSLISQIMPWILFAQVCIRIKTLAVYPKLCAALCPPNRNPKWCFLIAQKVRLTFFSSGQVIGSGDMGYVFPNQIHLILGVVHLKSW